MNIINDYIALLHRSNQQQVDHAFIEICKTGNIEVMHALLTSSELIHRADVNANGGRPLQCAVFASLEAVDFLLTSPLLSEHATLTENAFLSAASGDKLDIVKYLVSSSKLSMHADPTCDDNHALYLACKDNKKEFIDYYIRDLNIEVSNHWIKYSSRFVPDFDWNNLSKIIKAHKISTSLEKSLEQKINNKKMKI